MGSTPPIGYGGPTTKISGLDLKWFVCSKLKNSISIIPQDHKNKPSYVQHSQVYYDQFDNLVVEEMTKAWS